jgi:hypothetical protein
VAAAVTRQVKQWHEVVHDDDLTGWSWESLFGGISSFPAAACHQFFVVPTRTPWVVLWNDSAHCDGYDSLCACLARFHGLEAMHWSSSDLDGPRLAGSVVAHYRPTGAERHLYCCSTGSRWSWNASGDPLVEEDLTRYREKRIRARLGEEGMMALLERLGARPWREDFYDGSRPVRRIVVTPGPSYRTETRSFADIRAKVERPATPDPRRSPAPGERAPTYLGRAARRFREGEPGSLLADGRFCGHGEPTFGVFDIGRPGETFELDLPRDGADGPPVVTARSTRTVVVYDARRHPSSVFLDSGAPPAATVRYACAGCSSRQFSLAAGFEVPSDSSGPDDTSWFALAAKCAGCGASALVYGDETA